MPADRAPAKQIISMKAHETMKSKRETRIESQQGSSEI
jgi:hypothetical protein